MEPIEKKEEKILDLTDSDHLPDDVFTKIVYDALISSISGVAITDLEGSIKWINPAFMQMFGASAESQLIDRRLSELFTSHHIHAIEDIKNSVDKGESDIAEFEIKDEEGKIGYIELFYSDIHNYSGTLVGKMVSVHNITDRKLLENHLRHISAKLVDAQEEERKRVARELHDSVGASLVSLKFALEELVENQKTSTDSDLETSPAIIQRIQLIIDEVHNISKNLHLSILHDLGFSTAVRAFCRETQESFPAIDINIDFNISDTDIPEKLKIVIYRVIQEGLTNAAKHADADTIDIRIEREKSGIGLLIRDNGKGFDPTAIQGKHLQGKGIGLKNIQDRAEIYGGEFILNSTVEKGTTLEFSWPLTDWRITS